MQALVNCSSTLGDVAIIELPSLGNSHFQSNVLDNVENFLEFYVHIKYFVYCTHASYKHYR